MTDAGIYYAVATNEGGKAESSAKLTIKSKDHFRQNQPPVLSPPLSDQVLTVGKTLEFTIKSTPSAELTWKHNCVPVTISDDRVKIIDNPDGSQSLKLRNVNRFDAGKYTVEATNECGDTTSTANIKINDASRPTSGSAPAFSKELASQKAEIGSLVKFVVKVSGHPTPEIKWFCNGEPIAPKTGYIRMSEYPDGTNTLVLNDVQFEHSGEYSCIASNEFGTISTKGTLHASARPVIIKPLKDVKADANESITFEIHVEGYPAPDIKWMHNGEEIPSNSNSIDIDSLAVDGVAKLTIHNITAHDAGDYRVIASNIDGQVSSYGNLSVTVPKINKTPPKPPVFIVPLEDIKTNEGMPITFETEARGFPEPTLKWYHNEKMVVPQRSTLRTSTKADGSAVLSIKAASLVDAGEYKVVATNINGTAESKSILTVLQQPSIKTDLCDVELNEGTPLQLKIEYSAFPTPNIIWTHNGERISPDDKRYNLLSKNGIATLTLLDASVSDGGEYRVEVNNEAGSASTNAIVSILSANVNDLDKPIFVIGLYNRTVEAGKAIELNVRVSGTPEPTIIWLHNGQKIDATNNDNTDLIASGEGNYALRLHATSIDNGGEYRAIATNTIGTASSNAVLNVLSKPKIIDELTDLDVVEGEPITLSIKVSSSPPANIEWYRNGSKIMPDNRFIQCSHDASHGTHTISISKAKISDSGEYRVTAENELGVAESKALITVQTKSPIILEHGAKPRFETGLQDADIDLGSTIQLTVQVSGEPQPTLTWLHNGNELIPSKNHIIITPESADGIAALQIKDAAINDAGKYRVLATNASGAAVSDCVLSVFSKPLITMPLKDQYVIEGDSVTFIAKVIGTPIPDVVWLCNGVGVTADDQIQVINLDDQTFEITIQSVSLNNVGSYSLNATNKFGTATTSSQLYVSPNFESTVKNTTAKPVFLKQLDNVCEFAGFPVKFDVTCVGNPLPTLAWYCDDKEIVATVGDVRISQNPDGSAYLLLLECGSNDTGSYKVIATNLYGSAESNCKLAVSEKSEPVSCTLEKHDIGPNKGITRHGRHFIEFSAPNEI